MALKGKQVGRKLVAKCPICGKNAVEKNRTEGFEPTEVFVNLECGHTLIETAMKADPMKDLTSQKGYKPFPFQMSSVEFIEQAMGRALIGHEMGLGKTIIECLFIKRNLAEVTPCLIFCKSGVKFQWFSEVFDWCGIVPQVIDTAGEIPIPSIFKVCIVSLDLLRRVNWPEHITKQFKHICIDECQLIKNPSSARAKAVREIAKIAGVEYITALSGTAIKNEAGEYFTTLNLLQPMMFPSESQFLSYDCVRINGSQRYRLYNPEKFHDKTKHFILRFLRKDVMPELPEVFRQFKTVEFADQYKAAYIKALMEFKDKYDEAQMEKKMSFSANSNLLGMLSRMRYLTGMAKVEPAVNFIEEFLLTTDRTLVVFTHHLDVQEAIYRRVSKICKTEDGCEIFPAPQKLTTDNKEKWAEVVRMGWEGKVRVIIASELAAGEGLNLQFASDCLFVERQWNPANEEQAESRFPRPRPDGKYVDGINAIYLHASKTIDEKLHYLVELKRGIKNETLDWQTGSEYAGSLIKDLMEMLYRDGVQGL